MKKYFIVLILILGVVSFPFTAGLAEEKVAAPTPSYLQAKSEANGNVMIAPTGKKYHVPNGCRTVRGECKIITLGQAQRLGYTPCGVCNPSKFLK